MPRLRKLWKGLRLKLKTRKDTNVKPSQYEDIDDNFTILPSDKQCNSTITNDVTTTSNPDNTNVTNDNNEITYENVTSKTNLRNYEPKATSNEHEQPYVKNFQNTTANSSNQNNSNLSSTSQNEVQENVYVNYNVTSKLQTPSNEIQDGSSSSSANQNPKMGVQAASTEGEDSEPMYTKVKKGKKNKSDPPKGPPPKPKKKTKPEKTKNNKQEQNQNASKTITIKEDDNSKGKQLTYIEVEFTSPPSSSDTKKDDGKSTQTSGSVDSDNTTYTDVRHENGRLVLIR